MAKGEITHVEFPADDVERAKRFYSAVAGWDFGEAEAYPGYWMFRSSDASGGGLGSRGDAVGNEIRVYITVDSLETALEAVKANGGSVLSEPSEVPGLGRWASVKDSEGNTIGLWQNFPQ